MLWEETNQSFEGVVDSVNADGTYDINYEALVHGKIPRERNVKRCRLEPIFDDELIYWDSDHLTTGGNQSSASSVSFSLLHCNLTYSYEITIMNDLL